jgi:phosphoribosylamine--glycine ligase
MRILVLGSGAREHALTWKLAGEPDVSFVACAPANAGIARNFPVAQLDLLDADAVVGLARRERIDLVVIGPEAPLARGLVDRLTAERLAAFGPTRAAARLETSKAFAKDFMRRHHVPTARYRVCEDAREALHAIAAGEFGDAPVVKADGLAAGKGVVVAPDRAGAQGAVRAAMIDRSFGDAGARVVIEEQLTGPEVSCFVIADGERYVALPAAQDHKRIFDGDRGPNTGGMGAFAPSPLVTPALAARIEREIVQPVLRGMAGEGTPFRGFLYCGLMLTADGPKVIEFNVRFGDPEAQVVLPLLERPLSSLLFDAAHGRLPSSPQALKPSSPRMAVGVVLAAHGYPGDVRTGDVIHGLDDLARECPDVLVFHAGVKARDAQLVTAGGRVMTVVARAASYERAIARTYDAVSKVTFEGMQFRRDIGRKALRA